LETIQLHETFTTENSVKQDDDLSRRGIKPSDWNGLKGKSYAPPFSDERWLDIR